MTTFIYKAESFRIIGLCMKIQSILGFGFAEVIYKDAMEIDFLEENLEHLREPRIKVLYKSSILKSLFSPDFTCFDKIILEVNSSENGISANHIAQTLNYLKVSNYKVGLIINFGRYKLEYKRLALSK